MGFLGLDELGGGILGIVAVIVVLLVFATGAFVPTQKAIAGGLEQFGLCTTDKCKCISQDVGGESKYIWCDGKQGSFNDKCLNFAKPPEGKAYCDPARYPGRDCTNICDSATCEVRKGQDNFKLPASYQGCRCGRASYGGGNAYCCNVGGTTYLSDVECSKKSTTECDVMFLWKTSDEKYFIGDSTCGPYADPDLRTIRFTCTINGLNAEMVPEQCPEECVEKTRGAAQCVAKQTPAACPQGYDYVKKSDGSGQIQTCEDKNRGKYYCIGSIAVKCLDTDRIEMCQKQCGKGCNQNTKLCN